MMRRNKNMALPDVDALTVDTIVLNTNELVSLDIPV